MDGNNIQAIKEVLAKFALFDPSPKVGVSGSDDSEVERNLLVAPQALNRVAFENPQELDLE